MSTAELREDLHQMIDQADDRVLNMIHAMLHADMAEPEEYELSDAHKAILDERIAAHERNPQAGSDWETVKARILNNKL